MAGSQVEKLMLANQKLAESLTMAIEEIKLLNEEINELNRSVNNDRDRNMLYSGRFQHPGADQILG